MTSSRNNDDGLDLAALCDEAGVTPRTIYYYTQQGLLPAPKGGRGARYVEGHRLRLAWIRHRQKAHLPLAAIRQELDRLTDAELADLLAQEASGSAAPSELPARTGSERASPAPGSALEYIEGLIAGPASARLESRSSTTPPPRSPGAVHEPGQRDSSEPQSAAPQERSVWERHRLSEDIELHVRRPLDRITNRRVERLLELARQLLSEG